MTFLHGYSLVLQAFPFLLTYFHIWGHSCPSACISDKCCTSWHHPWAFLWRKSLKEWPVPKYKEITAVSGWQWTEHVKGQHNVPGVWRMRFALVLMHLSDKGSLLEESRLVFVFHMGSELDLSLDPSKLTGFIKRHGVGAIQYIVPGLEEKRSGE